MANASASLTANITTNADQAAKKVDAFTASAQRAERYSGALEAMAKRVGVSTDVMAQRVAAASNASDRLAKAQQSASAYGVAFTNSQQKVVRSLEDQIAKFTLSGKSYAQYIALRKMGVTADSEAGQKISQLAGVAYDLEQKFKKTNSTSMGLANTLTRRFVLTVLISQLRRLASTAFAINAQFAALGDTANRIGISASNLGGLDRVAGAGGIDTQTLLKDMNSFAGLLDESRHYATDLSNLFAANGVSIKRNADGTADLASNLQSVADLVRNASSEQAKFRILQQAGIDATRENVRLYEQGGAALKYQMDQAARPEFEALVRKADEFDRAWNNAWVNFKKDAQSAFLSTAGFLSTLSDKGTAFLNRISTYGFGASFNLLKGRLLEGERSSFDPSGFSRLDKFISDQGGNGKSTVEQQAQIKALQQINQQISLLGSLATTTDLVTQKKNELRIANLSGIKVSDTVRDAIIAETRLQSEAVIATAKVSLGLATQEDIRKQQLASLPPQIRAQAELTEAFRKQNEQLAMNNQVAAAALPGLKQLELSSKDLRTQLDTLGQGITNGISSPLVDLASGATRAGDAFKQMGLNVIRSIEQMIVNMTIAAPIARGLMSIFTPFLPGAGAGAVGGTGLSTTVTGGLYHTGGIAGSHTSSRSVDASVFFGAPRYHSGGIAGLMPDEVPAILRKGEPIFKSMDDARAKVGGGTSVSISIGNITMPQDPNGNDPGGERRAGAVAKALEGTVRNIVKDEMIRGQKPRGILNRASSI